MRRVARLEPLWSFRSEGYVYGLAFSDSGRLGVASSDGHAYIIQPNGELIFQGHSYLPMYAVSHCCGKFGFLDSGVTVFVIYDDGYVDGKINIDKLYKPYYYSGVTLSQDGVMVCAHGCGFFDFRGRKIWEIRHSLPLVEHGPSYYQGYWYIAAWFSLDIVKDGHEVNSIDHKDFTRIYIDTAICDKYLAVTTEKHLILYDISDPENPREIWNVDGFDYARDVAFRPDCRYIAVADMDNRKLKIYDINGNFVEDWSFDDKVCSVAWWNDIIAVGTGKFVRAFHF